MNEFPRESLPKLFSYAVAALSNFELIIWVSMVGPIPTALGQRYAIGINDDPRAATGAAPSTGARRAPNMPWHLHTVYREAQQRGEDARLCEGVQCGVRRWCSALRATRRELNALALGTGEYTENKCQRATRTKISGKVCVCHYV